MQYDFLEDNDTFILFWILHAYTSWHPRGETWKELNEDLIVLKEGAHNRYDFGEMFRA